MSSSLQIEESVAEADVVIGAVLIPGALAPKLVTREMVAGMKEGSVVCDVAIDQGGCFETSRPTTHSEPVYVVDGVTHYCVANMPGAVPITSTKALTNATLPYVEAIADLGLREGGRPRSGPRPRRQRLEGKVTYEAVAEAHGLDYGPARGRPSALARLGLGLGCRLGLLSHAAQDSVGLDDQPRDPCGEPHDADDEDDESEETDERCPRPT